MVDGDRGVVVLAQYRPRFTTTTIQKGVEYHSASMALGRLCL